jgi:glycopeptide antibiotics resistance protein
MELLGTHVPISWSTLLVLLCGVLLSRSVGDWLASSLGWRRGASVAAWIALSTVLALTVTPDGAESTGQDHCSLDYVAQVFSEPLRASGGVGGGLLNLLLLLPLGTALVMASGRASIAVLMVLALPVIIEVAQRSIPGRLCSISDYLTNTAGGILGVIIGVSVVLRQSLSSTVDAMK